MSLSVLSHPTSSRGWVTLLNILTVSDSMASIIGIWRCKGLHQRWMVIGYDVIGRISTHINDRGYQSKVLSIVLLGLGREAEDEVHTFDSCSSRILGSSRWWKKGSPC